MRTRAAVGWMIGLACAAAACGSADSTGTPVAGNSMAVASSAAAVVVSTTDPSAAAPSTTTPATTEPPGTPAPTTVAPTATSTGLAWRTIDIVDPTRPTDEVTSPDGEMLLAAAPNRTIPTVVLYEGLDGGGENAPVAEVAPRPLIVWMNGLGGRAGAGDPMLREFAEAGYVVAAPNSPEVSAPAGSWRDYPELPADISVVLDSLLDGGDGVGDDLAPLIDADRIGVAGHSMGVSAGAFGAVYHDCCRDPRLDAVAAFGASSNFAFGDQDYDFSGAPLLLVHGADDAISPVDGPEAILASSGGPAHLLVVAGADHVQPVYDSSPAAASARSVVTEFFDVYLAGSSRPESLDALGASMPDAVWTSVDG